MATRPKRLRTAWTDFRTEMFTKNYQQYGWHDVGFGVLLLWIRRTAVRIRCGMGLTKKQKLAIESLFHKAEEEVAASVGVRKETLRRWKSQPEFAAALAARSREIRAAAARILSMSSLTAAEKLKALIDASGQQGEKADPKVLLDTLKASGLFDAAAEPEEGISLDQLIAEAARLARTEDSDGGDGPPRAD